MSQWIQFKNPSETLQALRELVESNSIFSTKEVLQETQIAMSDRNLNKNACYITAESNDLVKAILSSDPLREHHIVEELPSNNVPRGVLELYREATFTTSEEHASHLMLIDTEQSEKTYKRMLDSVSRFPGYQMEYVRLEDVENPEIQLRGIKLIAVGHTQIELPLSIGGQRFLRLCGRSSNVGIPVSNRCKFIEQCEFLLPDLKGNEILLREHENRQWHKWKMSTLKLADTVTFALPSTETVAYSTLAKDYLKIAPEFIYDGSRRTKEVFSGNIIECIRTERGKGNPRLLELFDYIESSNLQNAKYYVRRRQSDGENPLAPVWHYIQYSVEDKPLPILYNAKRFIQPTVFARENLPIYLESGFRFKPDITNMLETLPKEHSLFMQLKSICEDAAEEDAVFVIEGSNDNQISNPRKLVNGRPLLDSLKGIDFLKDELLTINLDAELKLLFDAKNSMTSFREKYLGDLMLACDHEEKAITNELTEVLTSLNNEVKEACDKCDSLNAQKTHIKKLANQFERVVRKDSVEIWNELLSLVIKSLEEMATPRIAWLMEESERMLKQEKVLDHKSDLLRDIVNEITINLTRLNGSLDQCKRQKSAIDGLEKKANAAKQEFASINFEGTKKIGDVQTELEEWKDKIIAKEAVLKTQFERLKKDDAELSNRKAVIQQKETDNTIWRGRLESLRDSIELRIKNAKAEAIRLEQLENVEIPRKTIVRDRANFELSEIEKLDCDKRFKKLSSEVTQINSELVKAEAKRDSVEEKTKLLSDAIIMLEDLKSKISGLEDKEKILEEKKYSYKGTPDQYAELTASTNMQERELAALIEKGNQVNGLTKKSKELEDISRELDRVISKAERMLKDIKPETNAGKALRTFKGWFKK